MRLGVGGSADDGDPLGQCGGAAGERGAQPFGRDDRLVPEPDQRPPLCDG